MARLLLVLAAAVVVGLSLAPVATGTGLLCIVNSQFVDCGPVVPVISPTTLAPRPRFSVAPPAVSSLPSTVPTAATTTPTVAPTTGAAPVPLAQVPALPVTVDAPMGQGTVVFLKALALVSTLLFVAHAARWADRRRYRPLHRAHRPTAVTSAA